MSACPEFLAAMAIKAGLPDDEVDDLYAVHRSLCDKDGSDYGGRRWLGLVKKHLEDGSAPTISRNDPAVAAARAAERRAKELEDAEYAKTAVSLRDWVASLRARHLDGELLEPHEAVLAKGDLPHGHEDGAAWLMDSLRDVRTFDGRMPRRPNPCGHPGCGLPVREWTGFGGRRYFSGRCVDHEREEKR